MAITEDRALRIARSHPCSRCLEYSYKQVQVKPSSEQLRRELQEEWHAVLVCGVCGLQQELGIDDDGVVIYAG